jgi:hypothetical protein
MPVMSTYRAAAFTPEVLPPGLSCHVFLIAIATNRRPPFCIAATRYIRCR